LESRWVVHLDIRHLKFIDYDKADIWALGAVLGNMMCGRPSILDAKTRLVSPQTTKAYEDTYPIALQLLNDMINNDPLQRASCYDIQRRSIALACDFFRPSPSVSRVPDIEQIKNERRAQLSLARQLAQHRATPLDDVRRQEFLLTIIHVSTPRGRNADAMATQLTEGSVRRVIGSNFVNTNFTDVSMSSVDSSNM
jgi:serine/threonine protein kinase